jgi:hypothetical protein
MKDAGQRSSRHRRSRCPAVNSSQIIKATAESRFCARHPARHVVVAPFAPLTVNETFRSTSFSVVSA